MLTSFVVQCVCYAVCCMLYTLQDVPVLLTRGEFDEVSAGSALQVAAGMPSSGGQVVTFKGSGSYMHIGELLLASLYLRACVCVPQAGSHGEGDQSGGICLAGTHRCLHPYLGLITSHDLHWMRLTAAAAAAAAAVAMQMRGSLT
jgi:hypothetical protein